MKRFGLLWVIVFLSVTNPGLAAEKPAQGDVRTTDPQSPEVERSGFHLPPGFQIELVAAEPQIGKPINMAFDRKGRLWVTESREYPYAAPGERPGRDRVMVLEGLLEDGRAAKITTFADDLNIPTGVLPIEDGAGDGAIVWSIPNIWRLRDRDGDGRVDAREILYGPLGWEKDTHGMSASFRLGVDGWMYLTHGFNNKSTVLGKDGSRLELESGNSLRVRIDGSRVEAWGTGQVNPFGLAFDPSGNLYSTDSHSDPVYLLLRGGSYPSFGRPHDGLGFAPRATNHDHQSTALAGIAYYADDAWPDEFKNNVLNGNIATSRINRDRLVFEGSTPRAQHLPDFLRSDDPWFRPVDLTFGPDGALYVADFYNRIISHYEVPLNHPGRDRERGRIWRITYKGPGAHPRSIEDLSKKTPDALLADLTNPSLTVRTLATHELVSRRASVPVRAALRKDGNETLWSHGLWTLQRLGKLTESELKRAAAHPAGSVRLTVARILGERAPWRPGERILARRLLSDDVADVKRLAADALGRHSDPADIAAVLTTLESAPAGDSHLRQGLRIALRDHFVPAGRLQNFERSVLAKRYSRLVADVTPGIKSRAASAFLLDYLKANEELGDATRRYLVHAARFADEQLLGPLIQRTTQRLSDDREGQLAVASAYAQEAANRDVSLSPQARDWAQGLAKAALIEGRSLAQAALIGRGCELAVAASAKVLVPQLQELLSDRAQTIEIRAHAASALTILAPTLTLSIVAPLLREGQLPGALRTAAADLVEAPQWQSALETRLGAEAVRVQIRAARPLSRTPVGAGLLLHAVEARRLSPVVLVDAAVKRGFKAHDDQELTQRLAVLSKDVSPIDTNLDSTIEKRKQAFAGSHAKPEEGAALFLANCAPCHRLADKGNLVGPQLDGLGARGIDRLLEDIFDPNRTVDRAFRSLNVQLKGGDDLTGLLRREDAGTLILVDLAGQERAVNKRDIVKRAESDVSVMPDNFSEALSPDDTNRLLAFLMAPARSSGKPTEWKKHIINTESAFEGAGAADLNGDGRLDVFSGDSWYQAPNWKRVKVRTVLPARDPHYLEDFANLPLDVNGDGRTDFVTCSYFGGRLGWAEHPADAKTPWLEQWLPSPGLSETCRIVDLDKDGNPDLFPATNSGLDWFELIGRKPGDLTEARWEKRVIAADAKGHGLGFGDINGDGRIDIVKPNGWYAQPADPKAAWPFFPELKIGVAGIEILVDDVDGDGDTDLVWGEGHNKGLHWLAQSRDPGTGARNWQQTDFASDLVGPHTLLWADLDGNGSRVLVTGTRVYGHERDPDATAAPEIVAFRFDRKTRLWNKTVLIRGLPAALAPTDPGQRQAQRDFAKGTVGTGLQMQAVDMDKDGDLDLLCPGKTGLYWLENPRR